MIATLPATAQVVTGKIAGIVRDPSAAAVPGASVSVTNLATGVQREAQTNEVGQYVIPNLPAGEYRIEVTQPGFRPALIEKVELQVLQTVTADIQLVLGEITEQAIVTAAPPLLDSQTSDLGRVVSSKEIDSLPLDGRNYLQLATLTPGVNTFLSNSGYSLLRTSTQFQGPAFQAGTQNVGTTITVGVQRESATTYRIDGINITNPLAAQSSLIPSLENIQEFKVMTGVAPAAIHSPASVNIMTRSGTNSFHGGLYEFFRNEVLNARSYFDVTKPKVRMNQFGGSFGGPIIQRKTFFFANYEGFRGRTPATAFALLPTAAEMSGDFSKSAVPPVDPATGLPFP